MILALTLICRGSYRGVIEFLRDLLGVQISEGTVHNVHEAAARQAGVINSGIALSGVRVGLHDEIFQGPRPVLAGVDAKSTFCYLLAAETHRDGDTWGVHLMDAKAQGLNPDYTIADAGQGARVGAADRAVRHALPRRCVPHPAPVRDLANTLARIAQGDTSRCRKLQAKKAALPGHRVGGGDSSVQELHAAVQARTPRHEALSLPGRLPGQRQGVLDGVLRDHHRAHRHS